MTYHDVEQGTDEWLDLRIGKVTSSNYAVFMANFGKVFGDPAKRYALKIALERITGERSENDYKNEHMERGTEQEPIARMLYEEETFRAVDNGGFFDCGLWGDSPDGLISDDGVLEIKSVIPAVHFENLSRKSFDPAYRWQITGHLDATDRNWCDFVSFCSDFPKGKRICIYRINRCDLEEELKQLSDRRNEFLNLVAVVENTIRSL